MLCNFEKITIGQDVGIVPVHQLSQIKLVQIRNFESTLSATAPFHNISTLTEIKKILYNFSESSKSRMRLASHSLATPELVIPSFSTYSLAAFVHQQLEKTLVDQSP